MLCLAQEPLALKPVLHSRVGPDSRCAMLTTHCSGIGAVEMARPCIEHAGFLELYCFKLGMP
eukprot:7853799-Alexandrium_andersonii.AAC.1